MSLGKLSVEPRYSPSLAHSPEDGLSARPHFWRNIPGYAAMGEDEFLDPRWQSRASLRSVDAMREVLGDLWNPEFAADLRAGVAAASMAIRLTPYIISQIDWHFARSDPLRRQFLPIASEQEADHPQVKFDSLSETRDSPVPGLVHRYPDRVLFLPASTCPVYCAFCTRSYAVGLSTPRVTKQPLRIDRARWNKAFAWLASKPEVEDVVLSGGDAYNLSAAALREIGEALLAIPHLRRIRIATKGLAVLPSRIGRDRAWTETLLELVHRGRKRFVGVSLHTHFNHPREISWVTREAAELLFHNGVTVRNQSVLLRGVNDDIATMGALIKQLGALQIQPYYVYVHDMVPGSETLRTSLQTAIEMEKSLRGITAGFNMPTFVVDLPDGGGKRSVHSFESYDRESGVSIFRSPNVSMRDYRYFDPIGSR